jgi:pseudouridine kinase
MELNKREKQILEHIRVNPFISQQELADSLGISRPAVAGYISSLMKQGKILGRAYVLPADERIICIGGANIDRKGYVDELQMGTSNPIQFSSTTGGVARNIAENLGRLNIPVSLVSTVGLDAEGEQLLEDTGKYVDTRLVMHVTGQNTGSYTAILSRDGELITAFADMNVYDTMTPKVMETFRQELLNARVIVLDTNIPAESIDWVIQFCREEEKTLCLAPVSSLKIKKLPAQLHGVNFFIANEHEARTYTNMMKEDLESVCDQLLSLGCEKVVITRGKDGVVYKSKEEYGLIDAQKVDVVDVTGAGDAFIAGFLFGHWQNQTLKEACQYGMSCSIITLSTKETVSTELNKQRLLHTVNTYFQKEDEQ